MGRTAFEQIYVYSFKKIGSGIYQYKINNNAKNLEVKPVKCEYLFRVYTSSSRMH
jgi:hypothetical protein